MEFYFEILINTTKNIKINQQLVIFNQWLVGKQLFQSQSCVIRFIGQLDSQRSIPDPKRGNVTSTPQSFTFGPHFLVVNTNFHWWKLLFPRASAPIQVLKFRVWFCSTRFYECPYGDLIWQLLSLTSPWKVSTCRNTRNFLTFPPRILFISIAPYFHCYESFSKLRIYVSADLHVSLEFRKVWL